MLATFAAMGDNDVAAVQEGDTNLRVFRAPDWTRSTLVTFSGSFRYPRADLAGEYEIGLGLLDPQTQVPKVALAMEGSGPDGWHRLGNIRVEAPGR